MRNSRILPLLGPAAALYLLAEAASLAGGLDAISWAIAAIAVSLTLAPVWLRRRIQDEVRGTRRVATLGVVAGIALAAVVRPSAMSLMRDIVLAVSLPLVGALLVDLATRVPDVARPRLRGLALTGALVVGAIGTLAALPPFELLGALRIVPARAADLPAWYTLGCAALAFVLRLLRRRGGSAPAALASNAWAELGLAPGLAVGAVLALTRQGDFFDVRSGWGLGALGFAALVCLYGHTALVDPKRRLRAAASVRATLAHTLTAAGLAAAVVAAAPHVPSGPAFLALAVVLGYLAMLALRQLTQRLVRSLLAPFGGRLLDAIDEARRGAARAASLEEVAAAVLGPMRKASAPDTVPLLWCFDPARELRIDEAGLALAPGASSGRPPGCVHDAFTGLGDVIVAADVIANVVRRPERRELAEVLEARDVFALVPLGAHESIDGALVVPRGRRRARLTLEEIEALRELAAEVGARFATLAASERGRRRDAERGRRLDTLEERLEATEEERARLRAEANALRVGRGASRQAMPDVAYSAAMREQQRRVLAVAAMDAPVTILAEGGTPIDRVARTLHAQSARAEGPFVIADAGSLSEADAEARLFGGPEGPGFVALAQGGTLLIADVAALPLPTQRALADALAAHQARSTDGAAYALDLRLIAASRVPLAPLVEFGVFDPELAQWLGAAELRVAPLRERREDIPSLVLLALDRACRVLGREPVGIEQAALDTLLAYSWPGNLRELQHVIDHAVANAEGEQVRRKDLPPLLGNPRVRPSEPPPAPAPDPLEGTYMELERRILETALERAEGNKSEAARLLDLKRTTFLDKCRRHGLGKDKRRSKKPPPSEETV